MRIRWWYEYFDDRISYNHYPVAQVITAVVESNNQLLEHNQKWLWFSKIKIFNTFYECVKYQCYCYEKENARIRGIDRRFANIVCKKAEIDRLDRIEEC